MKTLNSVTTGTIPADTDAAPSYRPDSASIIHNVVTRCNGETAMLGRESALRAEIEKQHFSLLLRSLHDIAADKVPQSMHRLVREPEIQRAIAVLRRFKLLHPRATFEQLLAHCEQAACAESDTTAHLVDPFQLRHILTFHDDIPHEELTALELYELDRAIENGPDSAVVEWFAAIDPQSRSLPPSTPGYLRSAYRRACLAGAPAARLGVLSFESAVLTLRLQGVIGFEDTRLFYSLLKQIAGEGIPGLESYLESAEAHHAAAMHRAAGKGQPAEYFRQLANYFDHTALADLEQRVVKTAAERSARTTVVAAATPTAPQQQAAVATRRGWFGSLFGLGHSLFARG